MHSRVGAQCGKGRLEVARATPVRPAPRALASASRRRELQGMRPNWHRSKVWALGESVDLTFPGFIPFQGEDCFGGDAKTKQAKSEPFGATGRLCSAAAGLELWSMYIYRFDNE